MNIIQIWSIGALRILTYTVATDGGHMEQSRLLILLQLLVIAAYYDTKYRVIPNPLILMGVFSGALLLPFSLLSQLKYLLTFIVALMLLCPVFYLGGAGAGDLKLSAIVLSFLGITDGARVLLPACAIALIQMLLFHRKTVPFAQPLLLGAIPTLLPGVLLLP